MKNTKKVLLGGVAALALIGTSVFGTYMYLTSTSDTVNNSFSVGNVHITLDETDVDNSTADADRDITNNYPNILPGHTYTKDPIVHVAANSEECYLFVEVTNKFGLESSKITTKNENDEEVVVYATIAEQILNNGWKVLSSNETTNTTIYYYGTKVNKSATATDIRVFEEFRVDDNVTNSASAGNISVTAYAVQVDGFANAQAAWNATYGK